MTVSVSARDDAQQKLADLLTTALVSYLPAGKSVLTHEPDAGELDNPIVCVVVNGSNRQKLGIGPASKIKSIYRFEIMRLVAIADAAAGWTNALKEALFNDLEKAMADCVFNNEQAAGYWAKLYFPADEMSEILPLKIPTDYDMERSLVVCEVFNG